MIIFIKSKTTLTKSLVGLGISFLALFYSIQTTDSLKSTHDGVKSVVPQKKWEDIENNVTCYDAKTNDKVDCNF